MLGGGFGAGEGVDRDRGRMAGMHRSDANAGVPEREGQRQEVAVVCGGVLPKDLASSE
jgi:hypothetical protein